jgi:hypothetical protein
VVTHHIHPRHVLRSDAELVDPRWIKDCVFRNYFLPTKQYRIAHQ